MRPVLAQEAGDDQAAQSWTELACGLAEVGGDGTMGAYADVRRALIALYRGDTLGTISLARKAQTHDSTGWFRARYPSRPCLPVPRQP
jgi:hypothetical protein